MLEALSAHGDPMSSKTCPGFCNFWVHDFQTNLQLVTDILNDVHSKCSTSNCNSKCNNCNSNNTRDWNIGCFFFIPMTHGTEQGNSKDEVFDCEMLSKVSLSPCIMYAYIYIYTYTYDIHVFQKQPISHLPPDCVCVKSYQLSPAKCQHLPRTL